MGAGSEASSQPGPAPPSPTGAPPPPGPKLRPPDVVAMAGTLADEVVGLVQGLLPEVAGAVGVLRDHQHVLLEHQGLVTSQGPHRGPVSGKWARACGWSSRGLCDWPPSGWAAKMGLASPHGPGPRQGWQGLGPCLGCSEGSRPPRSPGSLGRGSGGPQRLLLLAPSTGAGGGHTLAV